MIRKVGDAQLGSCTPRGKDTRGGGVYILVESLLGVNVMRLCEKDERGILRLPSPDVLTTE